MALVSALVFLSLAGVFLDDAAEAQRVFARLLGPREGPRDVSAGSRRTFAFLGLLAFSREAGGVDVRLMPYMSVGPSSGSNAMMSSMLTLAGCKPR